MDTLTRAPIGEASLRVTGRRAHDAEFAIEPAKTTQEAPWHRYAVAVVGPQIPGMDGVSFIARSQQMHRFTSFGIVTALTGLDLAHTYGANANIVRELPGIKKRISFRGTPSRGMRYWPRAFSECSRPWLTPGRRTTQRPGLRRLGACMSRARRKADLRSAISEQS